MAETKTIQEILLTLGEAPINLNVSIPGLQGKDGVNGRNGDDGRSAFQIAQSLGFEGTEAQWIESLKAGAIADEARALLLQGNVWCKSSAISDVLYAIITNLGKTFPRVGFKTLQVPTVLKGQRVVAVEGEPHYTVKVADVDISYEIGDNGSGSVTIEPLAADDVVLTYHNFSGDKVGEVTIPGFHEAGRTPNDTYEENGVKYELFGRKLEINVTNFTGHNTLKMLGKWLVSEIDSILIKTSRKVRPETRNGSFTDKNGNAIGNIPIIVETPQKVTFVNGDNNSTPVKLGSIEYGTADVWFRSSRIEWSDREHKYINTGSALDHL
nr:MAG TPA: hypothetical protein [Caudoviricetes sp.]